MALSAASPPSSWGRQRRTEGRAARLFAEWSAIFLAALTLAFWLQASGLTARVDGQLVDIAASRLASPASDAILIAAIDDRSLAEIGQWPWDRRQMAQIVDTLHSAGARVIVLDIFYPEPASAAEDAALADAMRRSGRVLLAHAATDTTTGAPMGVAADMAPLLPAPLLAQAAAGTGHVLLEPDPDGTVRRIPLALRGQTRTWPHLAVQAWQMLQGRDHPAARGSGDLAPFLALRPAGSFRTVPAAALVRGEVPGGLLAGRTVIVGATAPGLGDTFAVSTQAAMRMSGAEIQANLLQDLDEDAFIHIVPPALWRVAVVLVLAILFIGFWRLRPLHGLLLAIGLFAAVTGGALALGLLGHCWFPPAPVLAAIAVAYPVWGWRRLSAVSAFLDGQARKLADGADVHARGMGGFDAVARQVGCIEYLIDEVSERRAFLARVIEAMPDALCVFGEDGGLLLSNRRAETIFGTGMVGLQLHDMILALRGEWRENPEDGKSHLVLPDGRIFEVEQAQGMSGTARQGGQWHGLTVVAVSDVTARVRAAGDRREMLEFLSHDMRAPQAAILGIVARTRRGEGGDMLSAIDGHARRTLRLADDFVQLARVSEMALDIADHDLAALADEALDAVWPQASERNCRIVRDFPEEPVFARCDGAVVVRMLENLLSNAVRYGRPCGTVEVAVRVTQVSGVHAEVRVSDDGPGLPPERRRAPFQRFGPRASGSLPGAGLGLAFVSEAVRRHSGEITWECPESGGTRFSVWLPAAG